MKNRLATISFMTGTALLMLVVAAFVIPSLLFLVKVPLLPLHFWLAAAASGAIVWLLYHSMGEQQPAWLPAVALSGAALLFVCCFLISSYFYDVSYDGQAYHQEAIIQLAEGWNPVYDAPLSMPTGNSIWVNHYAKAAELASASIFMATGVLEAGKAINLLLILASGLLSLSALLALRPHQQLQGWVVALLLALNPVSVYQAFSFYVDGLLASLLLCLAAIGCLIYVQASRMLLLIYTLTMMMMMNIKFTAIAYAGLLTIGLLIVLYMSEQFGLLKRVFRIAAIGGIAGVLLVGYNPYVTNTVRDGHPLYPLAGDEAIDVVKNFIPRNLERMNRFEQAGASYFAKTVGNSSEKRPTEFKWPFTFTDRELAVYGEPDVAVSGFGPLFSGILLLSLAVLVLAFRRRSGLTLAALGIIVLLAASAFVNPAAWWARYVPQLWFVPLICVWLALSLKGHRVLNAAGWTLALVIMVNTLLVGGTYTQKQLALTQELKAQLAELQAAGQPVKAEFTYSWSNQERLKSLGIAFKEESPLACTAGKLTLVSSGTSLCLK
ncbi:hypothetical protein [Paenibacillus rigui]|uniref:Glycosyltransferase RgtA/B/C/D-like domain-containing protein n=1 Tax=Paenibacillus rigui TaxID=554312 RepID=A0A229UHI4_9BACL|nr:hypothetical protein [Paenibacillus rigui]OXM82841.1 hypothetical protein CF651_28800 [Paenibacillus rigui]